MNITIAQLKYALALAKTESLTRAAEICFITQPAMSMQLKKLEDELGIQLFDRNKQPIKPTPAGEEVLNYAKQITGALTQLEDALLYYKDNIEGRLRIGIIPTLAPYLLPYFIGSFTKKYPLLQVSIVELKTQQIIEQLKNNNLDIGIMVTPIKEPYIKSMPLFYESFLAYLNIDNKTLLNKKFIEVDNLLDYKIWLLEEGNCFRTQTINLCGLAQTNHRIGKFEYESGNIETLIQLVEKEGGVTLIPQLRSLQLSAKQLKNCISIGKENEFVREVSIVYHAHFYKKTLTKKLFDAITQKLPEVINQQKSKMKVVKID
jgi:LysR family hydrogen peroxide-inducible transcriptional activator